MPISIPIGTHPLHAVGLAWSMKYRETENGQKNDRVAISYFGDGATSQGDVNEAYVFAASYQTPQVFFLQNNHWAISVPVERQSRTPLYLRAAGFELSFE